MPKLRFASFSAEGLLLLEAARSAAREIRDADPDLTEHVRLAQELRLRIARGAVFAAESG
jgi:ATP-dependent DNA helicase RecG